MGRHIYKASFTIPTRNLGFIEDPNSEARAQNSHYDGYDKRDERPREHLAQAWIR
jgi:hypothetical protein